MDIIFATSNNGKFKEFKKNQLNMGIFSYHGIIFLHSGQKLLGLIIDMFWGNLCTKTLIKLPKINPINKEDKLNKICNFGIL